MIIIYKRNCFKDRHSCQNLYPCAKKFNQSINQSVSLSVSLSVCLSASLSLSVSVCPSLSLSLSFQPLLHIFIVRPNSECFQRAMNLCEMNVLASKTFLCLAPLKITCKFNCHVPLSRKMQVCCHALKSAGILSCAFGLVKVFSKIMPSDIEVCRSVSILFLVFV